MLAFFIHKRIQTAKRKTQTHRCVHIALNVSNMPLRVKQKRRRKKKRKTNAIAKRKMHGIEITIQWAKYTAFRQEFHVSSTSVTCSVRFVYFVSYVCLWLNWEKEIENGELYFLFRRFTVCNFVSLWHRLTVYSSLGKQTNKQNLYVKLSMVPDLFGCSPKWMYILRLLN